MSIASKLKDLVIKWGGQPTKDDDSIEELIALLTELDAPGGGCYKVYGETTIVGDDVFLALDKTWAEIYEAALKGPVCFVEEHSEPSRSIYHYYLENISEPTELDLNSVYGVSFLASNGLNSFQCTAPDDYPTMNIDSGNPK